MQHKRTKKFKMDGAKVIILFLLFLISFIGCNNEESLNPVSELSGSTASGNKSSIEDYDNTQIKLSIDLVFKKEEISVTKLMESNQGDKFNNIVKVSEDLSPGQTLDLQELQPTGIFGLYLSSNGMFTLKNSDGMEFSSKTILMEKCSFIDLKLTNQEQYSIKVTGLVAGE